MREKDSELELRAPHRRADPGDAAAMADLVNFAGEGLPEYLWAQMAEPGQSPRDVGMDRAQRDAGSFSWRNTILREDNGAVTAALIGYPLPESPDPDVYDDLPAMFVPLQELEDLACGTWYINVLATYPQYRGRGFGGELLDIATQRAVESVCNGLSLIVADTNTGARKLYERFGYVEKARRPMVKDDWDSDGNQWVLMIRPMQG